MMRIFQWPTEAVIAHGIATGLFGVHAVILLGVGKFFAGIIAAAVCVALVVFAWSEPHDH